MPVTTRGTNIMIDFFISYTRVDRAWAEWIAWQLQEASYTVRLQAWHFDYGPSWVQAIHQASMEAERTIAVLSPDYFTAPNTQPEWQAAFAQDPTGAKGILLPIRVRPCDPPGILAPRAYIDLVGLAEENAHETLLTDVRHGGRTPITAPPFPGAPPHTVPTRPRFPGVLPPIWNVPHLRNPNFTDRKSLLLAMRQALTSGQPAALVQALSGLGGIGKTQLAVEYAYCHAADYSVVWWVHAEEPVTLAADYGSLAMALQLPGYDAHDQTAMAEAVRHWLEHNTGWLLVFDNAEESVALRPYLPRGTGGHILITSRDSRWRGMARVLPVREFDEPDAVAFLLDRTGETDASAARTLAEMLGNLPLALEQAGAYIEATGISLAAYLQLWTTSRRELLRRGIVSTDYQYTVATTWEVAMQRVQSEQPPAVDLLYLWAFLAPTDIPNNLIQDGCGHLPETLATAVADPLTFNEAIAALRRYSLLEREGEAFSVHRLVQAVIHERLGEEARAGWAEVAIRLVDSAFLFDEEDVGTWSICAQLLPHALSAIDYGEALRVAAEETGRLLDRVGGYFQVSAQFSKAHTVHLAELCERALAIAEATYSTYPPMVTARINNLLGLVLRDLQKWTDAREALERALEMDEATYGQSHPTVARDLNNLGLVLRDLGEAEDARATLEWALAIDEATYGHSHPTVARDLDNLGLFLRDLGEAEGARATLEQALAINEVIYGVSHSKVAFCLRNLGLTLWEIGTLTEARVTFERALHIFTESLGVEHPSMQTTQDYLDALMREDMSSSQ